MAQPPNKNKSQRIYNTLDGDTVVFCYMCHLFPEVVTSFELGNGECEVECENSHIVAP